MSDTKQSAEDLTILEQLNLDYIHSDQTNDVTRFREFADGVDRGALYTDTYQKRDDNWVCVGGMCARSDPGRLTGRHV